MEINPHPLKNLWKQMRARCENPKHHAFARYGGRGIKVSRRWQTFENFVADMGERPEGATLERKDNEANYSKRNCCWATKREQANNRRNNLNITIGGVTKTCSEWARASGLKKTCIAKRVASGWTGQRLLTPSRKAPKV